MVNQSKLLSLVDKVFDEDDRCICMKGCSLQDKKEAYAILKGKVVQGVTLYHIHTDKDATRYIEGPESTSFTGIHIDPHDGGICFSGRSSLNTLLSCTTNILDEVYASF